MCKLAMLSVHTCPLGRLGSKDAGGMNVYVRELALALGERSMSVDVFTRRTNPDVPEVVEFGPQARVIHLPAGDESPLDKNAILNHLPELVYHVRTFADRHGLQYRLVHSHYWLSAWTGAVLAARWRLPHVVMYHTLGRVKNNARESENETPQRGAVEERTLSSADAIVAASDHERAQMIGLYAAPEELINVVPCGVNLARFRPVSKSRARAQLGLGSRRVLVFVGRMQPLKGGDLLLDALALMNGRHDYELLVIGGELGNDSEITRLRGQANRLNIAERVSFLGAQAQDRLPLYYSAADACVMPSHYESFGLVAMEAMACGTPVIASPVGGLSTVIRDGVNGLLVAPRTPEAFSSAIDYLLTNDRARERIAATARGSVEQFSWEKVADRILTVYDNLRTSTPLAQACLCE